MTIPLASTIARLYRTYPNFVPVVGQLMGIITVFAIVAVISSISNYDAGAIFVAGILALVIAVTSLATSAGDKNLKLLYYMAVGMVVAQLPCMVFVSNAKQLLTLQGAAIQTAVELKQLYTQNEVRNADVWNEVTGAVLKPDIGGEAWVQLPPPESSDARVFTETEDGWKRIVPKFGLERQAGVDKRGTFCALPIVPNTMLPLDRPWDMRYDAVHSVVLCHNDWQGFVRCSDAFRGNFSSSDWWGYQSLKKCYDDAVTATNNKTAAGDDKAKKLYLTRYSFASFEDSSYEVGRAMQSVTLQNPLLLFDENAVVVMRQEETACCDVQATTAGLTSVVCMLATFLPLLFNICYRSYAASAKMREEYRRKRQGFAGWVRFTSKIIRGVAE